MLKSTYTPSPNASAPSQPLPPGWTEHKAPTGHTYYYHAETKESTYKRPGLALAPAPPPILAFPPPQMNLSDPSVANAFMRQLAPPPLQQSNQIKQRGGFGGRGGFQSRPRPQPVDKPKSKVPIPGCEPWILVYTKYGRRFAYNPAKNASYWRIPDKVKPGILALDTARIREKATGEKPKGDGQAGTDPEGTPRLADPGAPDGVEAPAAEEEHDYDSSEYEEIEVTDDEDGDGHEQYASAPKRPRLQEPSEPGPLEFTEDDIALQLAAMGAEYKEEHPEDVDEWGEADHGLALSDEDARELFKDMLDDFNINPYSPWEKLIEEGRVFDDPRYTVLDSMKARKEAWEHWSRAKISELKQRRAKEGKQDPRIPYMALLQARATPKLYWAEFKRKYKKEDAMRDSKLSDKDREKWYREHINRLKMPQATLKSDLRKLLESVPLSALNSRTVLSHLPVQLLVDIRYISLDPKIRDPLVEGYLQDLGPPPDKGAEEEEDRGAAPAGDGREKREQAMRESAAVAAGSRRRQEKRIEFERARLREAEGELEEAMHVDKKGLRSQLAAAENERGRGDERSE